MKKIVLLLFVSLLVISATAQTNFRDITYKEALAAAPPCDTFDTKLYHAIADKIVLHRTTPIQLKLINGMVV